MIYKAKNGGKRKREETQAKIYNHLRELIVAEVSSSDYCKKKYGNP